MVDDRDREAIIKEEALKYGFDPEPEPEPQLQGIPGQKVISVSDLIHQCNEAVSKMSANNDHRILIMNCGYVMKQLVDRLAFHEGGEGSGVQ